MKNKEKESLDNLVQFLNSTFKYEVDGWYNFTSESIRDPDALQLIKTILDNKKNQIATASMIIDSLIENREISIKDKPSDANLEARLKELDVFFRKLRKLDDSKDRKELPPNYLDHPVQISFVENILNIYQLLLVDHLKTVIYQKNKLGVVEED